MKSSLWRSRLRRYLPEGSLQFFAERLLDWIAGMNVDGSYRYFVRAPFLLPGIKKLAEQRQQALHLRDNLYQAGGKTDTQHFEIPKIVWTYWDSGIERAPEVGKLGLTSWQKMNPDYEVRFLDDKSVQEIFDFQGLFRLRSVDMGPVQKSDFIRAYLMAMQGGIWADITTFCWEPLEDWLPAATVESGFFIFRQPLDKPDRQIRSWFIASSRGNPIACSLLKLLLEYNFVLRQTVLVPLPEGVSVDPALVSRTGTGYAALHSLGEQGYFPYFYLHYLFNEALKQDPAGKIWESVLAQPNNHAFLTGSVDGVFVSKQTYLKDYMQSPKYRKRKRALLAKLAKR